MFDRITATVEDQALITAMDTLGDLVLEHTKPAALVTATNIVREMRARVRVRSGHTKDQIRVEEDRSRTGYVVRSNDPKERTHIDFWLEFGTNHARAFPFFYNSVKVEEGPHDRRMREAVQAAIDGAGLGD